MPETISYPEAFNYAVNCELGVEFLNTYGSAIRWVGCPVDTGEFLNWIDEMFANRWTSVVGGLWQELSTP